MKHVRFFASLIACLAVLVGCESTRPAGAGAGNQEQKRLAALQAQQQQPQPDESDQNLWNAQQDTLNRDSNPVRSY